MHSDTAISMTAGHGPIMDGTVLLIIITAGMVPADIIVTRHTDGARVSITDPTTLLPIITAT